MEQKVSVLRENRDDLKQKAKAANMTEKAYYQSQTRLFLNEFMLTLKGQPPVVNKPVSENLNTGPEIKDDGSSTVDLNDKKITDRLDKVKTGYDDLDKKFNQLNGKGSFEHKDLALIDPKQKSIVIDPRTQTLYYFENGVSKKIIQVGL